jgi:hypothetical protein
MLLLGWALFTMCAAVGAAGLVMAYRKPWVAIPAFIAVLCIAGATILRLRDPLVLPPRYRHETETWSYIAALFWSCVVGFTLPVVGLYLRSRGSRIAQTDKEPLDSTIKQTTLEQFFLEMTPYAVSSIGAPLVITSVCS